MHLSDFRLLAKKKREGGLCLSPAKTNYHGKSHIHWMVSGGSSNAICAHI